MVVYHVQKVVMEAVVVSELRVEGSGQYVALADGNYRALVVAGVGLWRRRLVNRQAGEGVYVRANVIDYRGADEHRGEGFSPEGGDMNGGLEAVDLATVGVAADAYVQGAQGRVGKVGSTLSNDDQAGAGSPDREPGREESLHRFLKLEVQHEAGEGSAFATGQNEALKLGQVVGLAHLTDVYTKAPEDSLVLDEVALKGKDADRHSF